MGKDNRHDKEWGKKIPKNKRRTKHKKEQNKKGKNIKQFFSPSNKQDYEEYEDPDDGFEKFYRY